MITAERKFRKHMQVRRALNNKLQLHIKNYNYMLQLLLLN